MSAHPSNWCFSHITYDTPYNLKAATFPHPIMQRSELTKGCVPMGNKQHVHMHVQTSMQYNQPMHSHTCDECMHLHTLTCQLQRAVKAVGHVCAHTRCCCMRSMRLVPAGKSCM